MDIALLTGAASNPGLAIAKRLTSLGLQVFGLDNDFSTCFWQHPDFTPVTCDLAKPDQIESAYQQILERESSISMVIHCGSYDPRSPVESIHPQEISYACNYLVQCPILLTRLSLPQLIKSRGQILFIENTTNTQTQTALHAGVNGFISAYTNSLFREVRDTGVKVTVLKQQANIEGNSENKSGIPKQNEIDPEVIADAIENLIRLPEHNAITELVIRPQATRSEPCIANLEPRVPKSVDCVQLPTKENFPSEPEPIATPEPMRPEYAQRIREEIGDIEEEDDELDFEIRKPTKKNPSHAPKQQTPKRTPEQPTPAGAPVNALKYLGIVPAETAEFIPEIKPHGISARSKPRAKRDTLSSPQAVLKQETKTQKEELKSPKEKVEVKTKTEAKTKAKAKIKPKVKKAPVRKKAATKSKPKPKAKKAETASLNEE